MSLTVVVHFIFLDMKCRSEEIFTYFFYILCVFGTLGLTIYWCYEFSLNEDLSEVRYKKFFQTNKDVYPTFSLCFDSPFLQNRLIEYGVNKTTYSAFLAGEIFSNEFININYSYVTINIIDYIKGYKIYFENATFVEQTTDLSLEMMNNLVYNSFNGFNSWHKAFSKCFAFRIPQDQNVNTYRVYISNKIFPNGERRTDQFNAIIHYPKQLLLSGGNGQRWEWPYQSKSSRYKTTVVLRTMDVILNRNTKKHKCNDKWESYDDWVLENHISEIGCTSPYQQSWGQYKGCMNSKTISESKFFQDIVPKQRYSIPCKTLENLRLDWKESKRKGKMDAKDGEFGDFGFSIYFATHTFKEIVQSR